MIHCAQGYTYYTCAIIHCARVIRIMRVRLYTTVRGYFCHRLRGYHTQAPLMIGYEGLNASTKSEHVTQTFIHCSIVKMKGRGSTAYEASMSYMSYIYIQHLWRQYRWWQGKTLYGTACADQSIPCGTQTYGQRFIAGLFEGHPICISTFHRSFYNNIEIGEDKYFD